MTNLPASGREDLVVKARAMWVMVWTAVLVRVWVLMRGEGA